MVQGGLKATTTVVGPYEEGAVDRRLACLKPHEIIPLFHIIVIQLDRRAEVTYQLLELTNNLPINVIPEFMVVTSLSPIAGNTVPYD